VAKIRKQMMPEGRGDKLYHIQQNTRHILFRRKRFLGGIAAGENIISIF
jgi:hypothetical protein